MNDYCIKNYKGIETLKNKATTSSGLKSLFYNGADGRSRTGTL